MLPGVGGSLPGTALLRSLRLAMRMNAGSGKPDGAAVKFSKKYSGAHFALSTVLEYKLGKLAASPGIQRQFFAPPRNSATVQ